VLREHDAGAKAADLARKHEISEATLYNWKAKYGDVNVSDAKRLRSLEDQNRKLKKLLAESMLDQAALKELLSPASSRATRLPEIEVSGIAARHSRLTPSTMLRMRNGRPAAN
jgi:putative transposase